MQDKELVMILEDMRSDFKAFKEGLDSLRETTDTRFERLENEIVQMNQFLQNMLFEHEKWLQDHNVKIGDHEIRLKSVEKKVA